ncbi:C40 family peptidase [Kitasatospora sp. NBC_00458]|uniref:C40 family peptidase n=1 Tax=Kitasatospora sp. NBC_00458 TaxID=2903568 RepID=UPI002E184344
MRIATGPDAGFALGPGPGADSGFAPAPAPGADSGSAFDADAALIGFEESFGSGPAVAGCACPACAVRPRGARVAESSGGGRIHRAVRGTCLATTVLAGAGVVGLTAGAGAAHAAPGKQGWDGSRYWFKNGSGEWRYTSHYEVYLGRTGKTGGSGGAAQAGSGSGPGAAAGSGPASGASGKAIVSNGPAAGAPGVRQGWDGSKYWFKNSAGEWRYTSHLDVYLSRTGLSGGGPAPSPAPVKPAPRPFPDAAQASGNVESALDYALAQLGKPYVWGGNGPSGYDCSGLVQQAYRRAGIRLPRVADDQYAATTPITAGQLRRGDLLFWSDSGRASGIHHVGIYLGGGKFVEAPRPGRTVRVSTISSGFHPTHFGRP